MYKISVIIPCYNSEKEIEKCLDALLNQTFKDFEVIIVDDCSTDNTVKTINNYITSHQLLKIKLLLNDTNSGPALSRNKAISLSESEYISFCDSDDWYEKNYLELMIKASNINDSDMVLCNSKKVLTNGKTILIENIKQTHNNLNSKEVLALNIDSLWSILIKRKIISNISIPNLRNGEDMAIIPSLIMESKTFSFVKEPIYNYYCRPGSLSRNSTERVVSSLQASFEFILKNKKEGFEKEIEFIGIKNVIYGVLLNHFKISNNKIKANELLDDFENKFPSWSKNSYIRLLPFRKRLFLFFAKKRFFFGIKALCKLHNKIVNS